MQHESQERCDNCQKLFPESKVNSHYAYCRRNIRRCDKCSQFIDINYLKEHDQDFHSKETCKWCSKPQPKAELENHQKNCLQKPRVCDYCETEVRRTEYDKHVADCGSRTKACPKCQRNIMLREYEFHTDICNGREVEPISITSSSGQRYDPYSKPVLKDEYRRPEHAATSSVKQSLYDQRGEPSQSSQLRANNPVQSSQYQQPSQISAQLNQPSTAGRVISSQVQQVQQASSLRSAGTFQQSQQQPTAQQPQAGGGTQQQSLIRSNNPAERPGVRVIYPPSSTLGSSVRQPSQVQPQAPQQPVQYASKLQANNLASNQPQKVTVSYNYNPQPPQQYMEDDSVHDSEIQKALLESIQKNKGPVMTHASQYQVNPASYQNIYSQHHHQQPKPTESGLHKHQPIPYLQPTSHVSHTSSHHSHAHSRDPYEVAESGGEDLLNTSFYGDLQFQEQIEASMKKDHTHHHHHQQRR